MQSFDSISRNVLTVTRSYTHLKESRVHFEASVNTIVRFAALSSFISFLAYPSRSSNGADII